MPKYYMLIVGCLLLSNCLWSQDYTVYFTGNEADVSPSTMGGLVLMGGATENDQAMQWFLQKANGGDVVVIRASGSDGYNDYLYSDLGIVVNSVETIVMNNANAAADPYVIQQIENAEALWIAGGNQWTYVDEWRDSPVEDAINYLLTEKNAVVGGTSAGMAVLGGTYFTAENGTIQSATALNNPYHSNVTLGHGDFLNAPFMEHVVTDQHYNNPDRKGRHVTFMARMEADLGVLAKGIASNEYTAVCIEPDGLARAFGDYPEYDDYVYFLQSNCQFGPPEAIQLGVPLTWNQENKAIKVYKVPATNAGTNTFDLNNWEMGAGGEWQDWWVEFGELFESEVANAPNCVTSVAEFNHARVAVFPTISSGIVTVQTEFRDWSWSVINPAGALVAGGVESSDRATVVLNELPTGLYLLRIESVEGIVTTKILLQ